VLLISLLRIMDIGIEKKLVDLLLLILLLVNGLLNLFLVYILLRMEDGEESTHGLDLRVVDLSLLEKIDILCILVFNEVIDLPFNAPVGAFCSPSLCHHFEPTGIVKGHILIVYRCFDHLEDSRFMNKRSEFVYSETEVPGVWN
jgi:hypothetical protein